MLVGRRMEQTLIGSLLERARSGDPGALVLRGEAGVGKTALMAHTIGAASGFQVLHVRGSESEAELAHSGLIELLHPILEYLAELPAPQVAVIRSALALGPPERADPFATAAATLALVEAAARDLPVLIALDDAQWIDRESTRALGFAARRLGSARVVILATVLEPGASGLLCDLPSLTIGPLSDADAREILLRQLPAGTEPAVVRQLLDAAGGNPLALEELPVMLTTDTLTGRVPLDRLLPVGERLEQAYRSRLVGLPPDTGRALVLAAAGGDSNIADFEAAAPALDTSIAALESAANAGLVHVGAGRIAFRDGLVRSAVYHQSDPELIRRAHRALAETASGERSVELRAWHLAAAADGMNEEAATALATAAAQIGQRGGYLAAGEALARSAELTPPGELHGWRTVEAAEAAWDAGQPAAALACLNDVGDVPEGSLALRSAIDHLAGRLAGVGLLNLDAGIRHLQVGANRIEQLDPERALRMVLDGWMLALFRAQAAELVAIASRARRLGAGRGDALELEAELTWQVVRALHGDDDAVDSLMNGHMALVQAERSAREIARVVLVVAIGLAAAGRHREVTEFLDLFLALARDQGAVGTLPAALAMTSGCAFSIDDWDGAASAAAEAAGLSTDLSQPAVTAFAEANLAVVAAGRGDESAWEVHDARARELVVATGMEALDPILIFALGLLALGQGRPAEAVRHLEEIDELVAESGPAGTVTLRWEGDFAEALVRSGDPGSASEFLRRVEQRERASQTWQTSVLLRVQGMLASRSDFTPMFTAALTLARKERLAFQAGRVELCWAERLVEVGQLPQAARRADAALRAFQALGATAWTAQATGLLDRAGGGRPPLAPREKTGPAATAAPLKPPTTTCSLLGRFAVSISGREIGLPGLAGRMVAFLALRATPVSSDELIETFWPDTGAEQGRARLRKIAWRVRQEAPDLVLRRDDTLALGPDVVVDAHHFSEMADRALAADDGDSSKPDLARKAVAHYAGELLPGLPYEEWTASARRDLRRRYVALLDLLAGDAIERVEHDQAVAFINRAIAQDPYDEQRYLRGAQLLFEQGRRGPALLLLERARRRTDELGLPLSAAMTELRDRIRRGSLAGPG